jgi:hypothetical protein
VRNSITSNGAAILLLLEMRFIRHTLLLYLDEESENSFDMLESCFCDVIAATPITINPFQIQLKSKRKAKEDKTTRNDEDDEEDDDDDDDEDEPAPAMKLKLANERIALLLPRIIRSTALMFACFRPAAKLH